MKRLRTLLRSVAAAIALLLGLAAWHDEARALGFNDLVSVLSEMDKYNVNPFPVKGQELAGAKGLFDCLADGNDVLGCLNAHKNDDFVKKFGGVNLQLPPWLDNLVAAYVAMKNNDFWGVVTPLGESAVCIVAQVMAAGLDLCGLVKDLIAVGEALLDAATAVGKFFADLGGGVYDAVACGIFGDCGSGPPPEQVAYTCFFAPAVKPGGLNAIEAVDSSAFPKLRDGLVAKAKAGAQCFGGMAFWKADAGAAAKAADIYTNAVEGVWTGDILQKVLAARDKKRVEYTTPQQISALAAAAAPKAAIAKGTIVNQCASDFNVKFGFAHVDRWLGWRQAGKTDAQKEALKLTNVTSNLSWCETEFWGKNLDSFAQAFRNYLLNHGCPAFGQQATCTGVASYDACFALMQSVNREKECFINVAGIGKELADKINKHFVDEKKSKYAPCAVVLPDGGAPLGNNPVQFVCTRPTQRHFCDLKFKALWPHGPYKPLDCAAPKLDPAYAAVAAKVKQAAAQLQAKHPSVGVDQIDPLVVHAGKPEVFAELQKAASTQRSSLDEVKFAFEAGWTLSIDGVSRPTLVSDFAPKVIQGGIDLQNKIIKPGDPDPLTKPAGGTAQPGLTTQVAPAAASAVAGAIAAQGSAAGQQSQVLSGPAPAGSGARTAAPQSATTAAPATARLPQRSQLPAVQTPAPTQLPAVQAPAPSARVPGAGTAAANWGALGTPAAGSPQRPSAAQSTRAAPSALATHAGPAALDAATERALSAASCARPAAASGLRFTCTTRAGFDRCEALRRDRKVEQCTLNERR